MGVKNYSDEALIMDKCFKRMEFTNNLNCLLNVTAEVSDAKVTLEFKLFSENSYFEYDSIFI